MILCHVQFETSLKIYTGSFGVCHIKPLSHSVLQNSDSKVGTKAKNAFTAKFQEMLVSKIETDGENIKKF